MKKKNISIISILLIIMFLSTISIFIYSEYINKIDFVENIKKAITEVTKSNNDLILTSKVNLEAANGKGGVDLDWSSYDATDKVFKAYQKKESSNEFESISTINFYEEIKPIKVLNIYPIYADYGYDAVPGTVSYKYLDGKTLNLPKSAALKVWMEGGTLTENGVKTNFDAYGKNPYTGQQIIKVTPVSSKDFNSNPNMIWNYDIIMIGTWNTNGNINDQPTEESISIIEKYINSGYGVLAGHDTIGYDYYNNGMNKLRKYFNIDIGYLLNKPDDLSTIDCNTSWAYMSDTIIVREKGLLTNFPYELPVGTKLTIPSTHSCGNAAKGNVWMSLVDGRDNEWGCGSVNNYYNARRKRKCTILFNNME